MDTKMDIIKDFFSFRNSFAKRKEGIIINEDINAFITFIKKYTTVISLNK